MKYINISTHPHQNRQCQWPPTTSLHYRLTMTFQNLLRPKDTPRKPIYSYLGKRNNIIKNDLEGDMAVPWSVYLAGFFWRKIRTASDRCLEGETTAKNQVHWLALLEWRLWGFFHTSLSALLKAKKQCHGQVWSQWFSHIFPDTIWKLQETPPTTCGFENT